MNRNHDKEGLPPDHPPIIERPDGYYWRDEDTGAEFGPFPTVSEAVADALSDEDSDFEPGETLQEAEDELGISDWIDPETGGPAEDFSPHIEDR